MCAFCFWKFWNYSLFWASSKNRTGTQDLAKNGLLGKTGLQELKALSFFEINIKDNVKMIHFHIKKGRASPRFRTNDVWKLPPKFLFWKLRIWDKKDNSQFAALVSMERFCMFKHFYAASFSIKTCFYQTSSVFLSRVLNVFSQKC